MSRYLQLTEILLRQLLSVSNIIQTFIKQSDIYGLLFLVKFCGLNES